MATPAYVRYTDALEQPKPDEEKTFDELAAAMGRLSALMCDRYRHATRSVHAKSHGLLRADLTVLDDLTVLNDLPPELAQGMFARPATIPAIVRVSTNPSDVLADSVSTPAGWPSSSWAWTATWCWRTPAIARRTSSSSTPRRSSRPTPSTS